MNQQINLYQPMFRKQQVVFSARTTLILALGFLVLLAIWWALLDHRVNSLESQLQGQQAQEQSLSARLNQLNMQLAARQPDPILEDEVERLEQRADVLRASRALVRQRIPSEPVAVSARLSALARQHPAGLWLTGIDIADSGREISLRGRMLNSSLLPSFLERLGQEQVFNGQSFRQLQVEQPEDAGPGLEFMISNADAEPQE